MKKSNTLQKWLDTLLARKEPGHRLPTAPQLARMFGCAPITVHRTIRTYVATGKLERISGKGTFIPLKEKAPPVEPPPVKSAAQGLADTIRQSIARGEYKKGDALPQLTFLSLKFKLSYQTVVKAFRILLESEQVIKAGKTFWVGTFRDNTAPGANREICIFNHISDDFSDIYTSNMRFAYRKMENELNMHGFRITYAGTARMEAMFKTWQSKHNLPHAILVTGLMSNDKHPPIDRLRRCLAGIPGNPPRILFDSHSLRLPKNPVQAPCIVLAQGHTTTASVRSLSDYMAERQYRRAVIFMDTASESWVVAGDYFAPYRLGWEMYDRRNTMAIRYIILPQKTDKDSTVWLRRHAIPNRIENNARRKMNPEEKTFARQLARWTNISASFDRWYAKSYAPGSLWVFTGDTHAAAALAWAEKQGISVPDELSIIGLEHRPEYFHLGLSYCGPDWDTLGYQMAHALIGDMPIARTGRGFLRTRADIFTKRTSK